MTPFGQTKDGRLVDVIEIANDQLRVKILTLGAILNDVRLVGHDRPLTLGSPEVAAYEGPLESFGSLMGPVINRIKRGQAEIDGQVYQFETQGTDTLHSGSTGMQHQVWECIETGPTHVTLGLELADGLGGFPGNRKVQARYEVAGAALRLTVTATTDAPTLMNPANHSYWALDGDIGFAGHNFRVAADRYTLTDETLIPTGELAATQDTPFDFQNGKTLDGGPSQFFDFNLCLSEHQKPLRDVAWLTGQKGVTMTVATTECGLQVYDCGTIDAPGFGTHHGTAYHPYSGLALEAQSWPGATSHAHFPQILLRPGENYEQITQWSFAAT